MLHFTRFYLKWGKRGDMDKHLKRLYRKSRTGICWTKQETNMSNVYFSIFVYREWTYLINMLLRIL